MSHFTIDVNIPALDRLCGMLETRMLGTLETYFRAQEKAGAAPEFQPEEIPALAQEAPEKAENPAKTAPVAAPEPEAPAPEPVTLDAVQRAAAYLRDQGKLKMVTDLFPEFGIQKLSDLKGDALQTFAAKMRGMGAML